jgi:hypothetical protein
MLELHLPQHNLDIINFEKIYKDKIIATLFRLLEEYNITSYSLKNKDFKKLLIHSLIHSLCEEVLHSQKNEKIIVYYCNNTLPNSDINKHIPEEELINFFENIFKKISIILPIKFYITSNAFDYFIYLLSKNRVKGVDILQNIKNIAFNNKNESFTFNKIRKYTKKYGLTFLSEVYFNTIKSKQLLLK